MRARAWCATRWAATVLALALATHAAWIPAKAALAQALLARAWTRSDHGRLARRPWPWADTVPVARLTVPRLGRRLIVLAGDSGQALAFGPGWSAASAPPGAHGLGVISAHRDTAFRFLGQLLPGDRIVVDGPRGEIRYRVRATGVVDSRRQGVPPADTLDGLWLVTCYPFDALVPGGPLRYVVQATRERAVPPAAGGARPARALAMARR